MEKYKKIRVLGSGSFGSAWLVHRTETSEEYVIKEISIPSMKIKDKDSAINEVKILSKLRHKNVVRYREAFIHDKNLCIAMEYADDGDLCKKVESQKGKLFMELQIIDWFVQILIAVKYIHSLHILHRDLKSQNMFLTRSGLVKIGDFGISRYLIGNVQQANTTIGTPYYLSPEICQQKPYNNKSDMWSLGVLLYELSTLKHPFRADDFSNLVVKIIKGKFTPISSCYGPLLQDLVLILLQVNPDERPSASQLLKVEALQPHVQSYLLRVKHKDSPVIIEIDNFIDKRKTRRSLDYLGSEDTFVAKENVQSRNSKNCHLDNKVEKSLITDSKTNPLDQNEDLIVRNVKVTQSHSSCAKVIKVNSLRRTSIDRQRSLQAVSKTQNTDQELEKQSKGVKQKDISINVTKVSSFRRTSLDSQRSLQTIPNRQKTDQQELETKSKDPKRRIICVKVNKAFKRTSLDSQRPLQPSPNKQIADQKSENPLKSPKQSPYIYADKAISPSFDSKRISSSKSSPRVNFIERNKSLASNTPPLKQRITISKRRDSRIQSYPSPKNVKKNEKLKPCNQLKPIHQMDSNGSKDLTENDKEESNPHIDPSLVFPNVRKRAASMMSIAHIEDDVIPLKIKKRSNSAFDKIEMYRKQTTASHKTKLDVNVIVNEQLLPKVIIDSNNNTYVKNDKMRTRSKSYKQQNSETILNSREMHGSPPYLKVNACTQNKLASPTYEALKGKGVQNRRRLLSVGLPIGTKLSEGLKSKIVGRLRAASVNTIKDNLTIKEKKITNENKKLQDVNKKHTATYTVLCPQTNTYTAPQVSNAIRSELQQKYGEEKLNKVFELLRTVKVSHEDLNKIKMANSLISSSMDSQNDLIKLLDLMIHEN